MWVDVASGGSSASNWASLEYLVWNVRDQHLSTPIVTTTTGDITAPGAGGLGRPGTEVLLGDHPLDYGSVSGVRLTIGGSLNCDGTGGYEVRAFITENASFHRSFTSDASGNPVIATPIFDIAGAASGGEDAIAATAPGATFGYMTVRSYSRLWGLEANSVMGQSNTGGCNISYIAGFRYADLKEDLSILGVSSNVVPAAAGGGLSFLDTPNAFDGTTTSFCEFRTRNQFWGGQVGARASYDFGQAYVGIEGELAVGVNHESVDIRGQSTLTTNGVTTAALGGIYALPSNIGRRTQNEFCVIPEINLKLGYHFSDRLSAFIGYDFMYWSNVVRPGEQIDRNVNLNAVPTVPTYNSALVNSINSPVPRFETTDYWAQGVNFGVELKF